MKNIAIVAHKHLPQPDDDLVYFLHKKNGYNIFHVKHSFSDTKNRRSVLDMYPNWRKIIQKKTLDYTFLPESLIYVKEFFFTAKWLLSAKRKIDLFIGMDGLCSLFGIILKTLGVCKKVVYWNMDFVPFNRFDIEWKNSIYHRINIFACKNSDEVWDLSPKMIRGRKMFFNFNERDYKFHQVVLYGVWTDRIKKVPYEDCQKNTLVFMGHLLAKQGVDMVIKKIPDMIKQNPKFIFKIIGDGNYKDQLVKLANELSVGKYCKFLGRIGTIELEKEIAKSTVAIAPYLKTKDSYTHYSDPGKVKTYLACGVPILLTDLPWNTKEIEKNKCGMVIEDDGSDLIEKLVKIMNPGVNKEFRKNAIKYSESYDYEKIFESLKL